MWKLSIDPEIETEYLNRFQNGLVTRIKKGVGKTTLSKTARKLLIEDYLEENPLKLDTIKVLLIGKPDEAYRENKRLMQRLAPGYDDRDASTIKNRKTVLKKIENVFNYTGVISGNKANSYWLAGKVGHNSCTYCNRQYTITVNSEDGKEHWARPQFDHWFPKEVFPLLSLNLYNLIPSCSVCNSSVKGRGIFHLDTHIHPYLQQEAEPQFRFVPRVAIDGGKQWSVCLEREDDSKEDNTIKAFQLDDIYETHGDLEVKDLMDFATGYTEHYLHNLFDQILSDYSSAGYTREDVFRMVFGAEYMAEKTLDRPLSKLKRDLLTYLGVI